MTVLHSLLDDVQDAPGSGSATRQLRALTRITDLFLAGSVRYSQQQVQLFEEVFKIVVEAIELRTRIRLAHHLAADPTVPPALVRAIAENSQLTVAAPVLSQSPVLTDADLIGYASTQGQGQLLAIAQRTTISTAVTDILIERGEQQVVHAVASNAGAQISETGFADLVLRASADGELALHVGTRCDIPRHHFLRLLETASASVCNRLIEANPQLAATVQDVVTDIVDDINGAARRRFPAHVMAKRRIKRLSEWKELGEGDVHAGAKAQDFERTATALAALAGCGMSVAERALLNENPGAVQIVAKAAGCSWTTTKALLLMAVADRHVSKADLERARKNYEQLERTTAQRVLKFHESRRALGDHLPPVLTSGEAMKLEALMG